MLSSANTKKLYKNYLRLKTHFVLIYYLVYNYFAFVMFLPSLDLINASSWSSFLFWLITRNLTKLAKTVRNNSISQSRNYFKITVFLKELKMIRTFRLSNGWNKDNKNLSATYHFNICHSVIHHSVERSMIPPFYLIAPFFRSPSFWRVWIPHLCRSFFRGRARVSPLVSLHHHSFK